MMRPLALCLLLAASPASAAQLHVGFGEADVTPDVGKKPVLMAGFGQNRKATKVHDPIMARAVVLSDGTDKIALVSVDVVGLFLPTVERVRAKLPGFKYVLVSSTHNHEGPDTLGLWGPNPFTSGVDPDYLSKLIDGAAAAVKQAEGRLAPAAAEVGTAKGPELLHDGRKPVVLHDDMVVVRFVGPESKKLLGLWVEWNVHPELMDSRNTELTADHVGFTVAELKRRHGVPVAYFTGTVGGLMTNLHVEVKGADGKPLKDGTWEKTEKYGVLVADLVDRAAKTAEPATLLPFDVRTRPVLVPVENGLYKVAKQVGVLAREMYEWTGDPTPKEPVSAKDVTKPVAIRTEIGLLRLGELDVALIPGEIYPELVLGKVQEPVDPGADFPDAPAEPAVYAGLKGKHRMLIGLANDEIGYILPKRQWDEKPPFCYGLKKSQYGEINSVGPEAGPVLCRVFRELAGR